jgi:hypothetical protein
MDEAQFKDILKDPEKILNLFRLFHQFLHILDKQEAEKIALILSNKKGTIETAGLGDKVNIVLTDSQGNIKKEVKQ